MDFDKAIGLMEHSTIIRMLHAKEFSEKWINWITDILSAGTSFVVLNGVVGKGFKCMRHVRQGDPLSPFFVIVLILFKVCSTNLICMEPLSPIPP